ncbi:MAG TPA: cytochrome P450 [Pseudonocardiaceae bacterium]|jgi:cytochrome P450|nr:cytochrome P450 [Pseudonocardiaceae bacterium]
MVRTAPFDPPPQYAHLRADTPVTRAALPGGRSAWLVSGHENVRRLLADPRVSSDRTHPAFPMFVEISPEQMRKTASFGKALIGADPPEHTDRRRMLITEFTVRRIQGLRPRIEEIVHSCIDAMIAGDRPVDLVRELALPVPSLVICELLGVPYEDREFFQGKTRTLIRRTTPPDERSQASDELRAYFDRLITAKEHSPGDDLLGRLIVRNRETPVFSHELLIGLATLLLLAGHETTANVIALGTLALLENPDQLAALNADPTLVPTAVEEMLRYLTIVEAGFRVAMADIEIAGTVIRAGEGIVALGQSANRDQAAFQDADQFDIGRGARHHVAFGYGIHQCLGQNLARMELEVVFGTLFRRLPGLRVSTPLSELPFKDDAAIYGLYELPVTW